MPTTCKLPNLFNIHIAFSGECAKKFHPKFTGQLFAEMIPIGIITILLFRFFCAGVEFEFKQSAVDIGIKKLYPALGTESDTFA